MSRPRGALAMSATSHRWLVDESSAKRLAGLLDVDPDVMLTEFGSADARAVLASAKVLITGWGCPPLTAEVLDRVPALELVLHAAGTVKGHLRPEVWDRGIRVVSAADAGAVPVAEYTLAAILFANKRVLTAARLYRSGRTLTVRDALPPDAGNRAKRIGLVGASRVGRRVAALLRPFDFTVLVADPFLDDAGARELGAHRCDLPELLASCDVVSLHAPSTPATRHMIGRTELALLRDGATLINTAHGALIDHDALIAELRTGRLQAVLDVTEPEPLPIDSPLFDLPNVLLTPHWAGAYNPSEAKLQLDLVLDELERFLAGAPLWHEVLRDQLDALA
jgi:phosphoglycerate dehydrogenase-like enzyme